MFQPRYDQLDGKGHLPNTRPVNNEVAISESQIAVVSLISCPETQNLAGVTEPVNQQLNFLDGDSK
jgi:hypothetical protein